MSLNWSVQDCKDWKTLTNYEGSEDYKDILQWKITDSLIWASMPCGFNRITNKNYEEVWLKVSLYERYLGNYINKLEDGTKNNYIPYYITLEDVKRRIGLHTNSSPYTVRQVFGDILKSIKERGYKQIDLNTRSLELIVEGRYK